jgi:hypothetical protein
MTEGQKKLFAMLVLRGLHLILCVVMSHNKDIWEESRKAFTNDVTNFCSDL